MKKTAGMISAALLLATSAMAADAPTYNCDWQPSCEVAPGIYGAMASPVKSKFDLSIGGFVKLDYAYNSVNFGPSGFQAPNGPIPVRGLLTLPTTGTPPVITGALKNLNNANQDQSILAARESRFWLKTAGPTFMGAKTGALIEMDFQGDPSSAAESAQVRLRSAYGTLDWTNTQFLFGQTQDIFGPAVPFTHDFRNGTAFGTPNQPRVPQIRLTQKVPLDADNSLKLIIGVQDPNQDKNNNINLVANLTTGAVAQSTTVTSYGAAVNAAAQLMFISKALGTAPGVHGFAMNSLTLGLFGLVGSQKTVDTKNALNNGHAVDVYGYGFYGFVPILKSADGKNRAMTMSLETQAYISSGMAFNSANGNTLAAQTSSATVPTGPPTGAKGYGVYGQLIFYPTQDLGISSGYERRNAFNYASMNPNTASAAVYEQFNENIYANVSYDLNAAVRVATEYEHQRTQYGGGTDASKNPLYGTAVGTVGNLGQNNTIRFCMYYFF